MNGEYEIVNSREIVASFAMEKDFVGTPTITLISPEKSADINFFLLDVNGIRGISLQELSEREPMFVDDFKVETELAKLGGKDGKDFIARRLKGTGLRRSGKVQVDGVELASIDFFDSSKRSSVKPPPCPANENPAPFAFQESTQSYLLCLKKADSGTIRYHQPTRRGFEESEIEFKPKQDPLFEVRHYRRGIGRSPAEVDLTFNAGSEILSVRLDDPPQGNCNKKGQEPRISEDGKQARVKCLVPPAPGGIERDLITVEVVTRKDKAKGEEESPASTTESLFADIPLPVRPRLVRVRNSRTGRAEGFAEEKATAIVTGVNLQEVTGVLFGDQEAKLDAPGDPNEFSVRVPLASLPGGEALEVPVVLELGADGKDKVATGAVYTYRGKPRSERRRRGRAGDRLADYDD